MKNGDYRSAVKVFQTALDSAENSKTQPNPEYIELIRKGLQAAKDAPELKQQGSKYTIKREDIFN